MTKTDCVSVQVGRHHWTILAHPGGIPGCHGVCDFKRRLIIVDSRLDDKTFFETLYHEIDHLLHPKKSERAVERDSRRLAQVLWQLREAGFRGL